MERGEKVGLGVAAAGHLVLFGLLSVGFLATPNPEKLKSQPVEVSLVGEVALESAAPAPAADPAQSSAPEEGAPEDAAPPEPAPAPPEPAPEPRPAPPPPVPAPAPRPQPAPPKPASQPKAVPKSAPKQPTPPASQPKSAPKQAQPKTTSKSAASAPKKPTPAVTKKGTGTTQTANASRPRQSRLDESIFKGLTPETSRSTNPNPPAATMNAKAAADIGSAIRRQVQPCANRNVSPGPGANQIIVPISLRLNRDGSLAGRPTVKRQDIKGVNDDNRRYLERVEDLAIAAFVNCAPLRGLPPELYDVSRGWRNFTLNYKLPG